jgi:hypothetical protein
MSASWKHLNFTFEPIRGSCFGLRAIATPRARLPERHRYLNTEDYAKFVPKLAADERASMERLGLLARSEQETLGDGEFDEVSWLAQC